MKYEHLKCVSYQDKEAYARLYDSKLNSTETLRVDVSIVLLLFVDEIVISQSNIFLIKKSRCIRLKTADLNIQVTITPTASYLPHRRWRYSLWL